MSAEERAALVEALVELESAGRLVWGTHEIAYALAPVVDRLCNQRAAAALEEAAGVALSERDEAMLRARAQRRRAALATGPREAQQ